MPSRLVGCESPAPQTTECVLEPNLSIGFHPLVPPKSHSRLPSHNQVLCLALSLLCSVSLVKNDYQSFLTSLPSIRSQKEKQTACLLFLFARMLATHQQPLVPASQPLKSYGRSTSPFQSKGLSLSLLC